MKRIYGAYGSNLNIKQMKKRCPTAKVVGTTVVNNVALVFRGTNNAAVATLEPKEGSSVPMALWSLEERDELALDHYEGYPDLYRKEMIETSIQNINQPVTLYLIDERYPYGNPSSWYLEVIEEGYRDHGFDEQMLLDAVSQTKELVQISEEFHQEQVHSELL
ncbi:gamma-glutamylcyclotransferase [Erysipelothrix rhusiopathiae]|nr:gamma-glutamylcyclotransferase [Erysipelothrix rhusiopathiae]